MLSASLIALGVAVTLGVVAIASRLRAHLNGSTRFPPSPPSDPILGHARRIPQQYPWETFSAWKKAFGDIVYVHVLGRPMFILNSAECARNLFEKRSANFSDRPRMPVIGDLMGWSASLSFLPYGDRWRRQRRLMQRYFDAQAVHMFRPVQQARVRAFLRELLDDPDNFANSINRLSASIIVRATYGYTMLPANDPFIEVLEQASAMTSGAGATGGTLIDVFPMLRHMPTWLPMWFPGVAVKRHCLRARELVEEVMSAPLNELKAKRASGTAEICFVSKLLDDYEDIEDPNPELEEDIKALGAITYLGGFDTTASTMLTFFLMMVLHPSCVKKAQAEIDRVIGTDRLPTLNERAELPYIDCILKEVFRIYPTGPLGFPHRSIETDHYGSWCIPGGSMLIPNIWQMMNDERYFPDPRSFTPERFLDKVKARNTFHRDSRTEKEAFTKDDDPSNLIFGFGRRICPGRFFAEETLWLMMACFLAVYDVGPYIEPFTSKKVYPEAVFQSGVTSPPKPFRCSIVPRSDKHLKMIQRLATV